MWESEIVLALLAGVWILYELYGRTALEWLAQWTTAIRIVGGLAVIVYFWMQMRDEPEQFQTTLEFAKTMLTAKADGFTGTTKEKRNVTGLMKKTTAANQKWLCGHCRSTLDETYEVDHIQPLFQGGSNDMSNLVALCPNCHRKKTMKERL